MTLDAARIHAAVAKARAEGWTIACGSYIRRDERRCCPLGALALSLDPSLPSPVRLATGALHDFAGYSFTEIASFAEGFDGEPISDNGDEEAHALGAAFRRELLGEAQP